MKHGPAWCVAVGMAALAVSVQAAEGNFVQPPVARWDVTHRQADRPGLALPAGEAREVRFVGRSISTAVTPWDAGARPIAFSFGLEVEKGHRQAWRWPGVFVALLSARPEAMTEDDLAIVMSIHLQGPMVTDRKSTRLNSSHYS